MAQEKALGIVAAQWSAESAALLARSMHDPIVTVDDVRALVERGTAKLFDVLCEGARVGAFVIQRQEFDAGSECVIVAAGADLPGFSLTAAVLPFIESVADMVGADRVRISASRPGMERRLQAQGYHKMEATYTKGTGHVRRR